MHLPAMSDLKRYLSAQHTGVTYERALAELRGGRKRGHWIWFVLPQLQGLGRSAMSQRYGIDGLAEAQAYLAEPELRQRLEEVIRVVSEQLEQPGQTLSTSWAASWMPPKRSAASPSLKQPASQALAKC
jgi:uncharacterized protein (DUF1810 family)